MKSTRRHGPLGIMGFGVLREKFEVLHGFEEYSFEERMFVRAREKIEVLS